MSPLRWTTKSLRNLAEEPTLQGHPVSALTVGRLLKDQGFSLQADAKTLEGKQRPDRDVQFRYINELVKAKLRTTSGQTIAPTVLRFTSADGLHQFLATKHRADPPEPTADAGRSGADRDESPGPGKTDRTTVQATSRRSRAAQVPPARR